MEKKIKVPVLLGPTAVGKTEVSLMLAQQYGFEIISCDSRQIYRFMNIGTAKPSEEERKKVTHWLVDCIDPKDVYSAFRFSEDAEMIIRECSERGVIPLICGGTGFYFKSLSDGLGIQVASNPELRNEYMKKLATHGVHCLYNELKQCDPDTAQKVHPHDFQRIIRALLVFRETGMRLSHAQKIVQPPNHISYKVIILSRIREELYRRINERVDEMICKGLQDEFAALCKNGYSANDPGMQCVGYKELFAVEKGIDSFNNAVCKIKQNTRHYAKRQMTWFTNKTKGVTVNLQDRNCMMQIQKEIDAFLS